LVIGLNIIGGASKSKKRKRKKSHQRNVYIIARPLQIAGHASSLSNGKFPVCHWGLLMTKAKQIDMYKLMREWDPWRFGHQTLGNDV